MQSADNRFSKLNYPLTDLNKKDAFKWNEEAEKSFQKMKEVMISCPILALLDFSKPFVVECDASGGEVGAVLKQGQNPIAFERRKLQPHEKIYSIYEKLMLSIKHALAKFQQLGRKQVCGEN